MCVVSAVYDDFNKRIPSPAPGWPWTPNPPFNPPQPFGGIVVMPPPSLAAEIEEMRKLIAEFHTAVELAKKLDLLMRKPDCADPTKAALEERVADLERRLDEVAKVLPAAGAVQ